MNVMVVIQAVAFNHCSADQALTLTVVGAIQQSCQNRLCKQRGNDCTCTASIAPIYSRLTLTVRQSLFVLGHKCTSRFLLTILRRWWNGTTSSFQVRNCRRVVKSQQSWLNIAGPEFFICKDSFKVCAAPNPHKKITPYCPCYCHLPLHLVIISVVTF